MDQQLPTYALGVANLAFLFGIWRHLLGRLEASVTSLRKEFQNDLEGKVPRGECLLCKSAREAVEEDRRRGLEALSKRTGERFEQVGAHISGLRDGITSVEKNVIEMRGDMKLALERLSNRSRRDDRRAEDPAL